MFPTERIASLAALALGASLVVAGPGGAWAQRGADPGRTPHRGTLAPGDESGPGSTARGKSARVIKLDKKTARTLGKLSDNQMLDVKGKRMTVGRYKTLRVKEQKEGTARLKAMRGGTVKGLAAIQADFESSDEGRLSAANAKVAAEAKKRAQQDGGAISGGGRAAEIQTEAAAIQNRVRGGTATPADETRAKELYDQYQQLE